MLQRMKDIINLVHNMGWRYVAFRSKHELLVRSGILKNKFPVKPPYKNLPTLADWQASNVQFFFGERDSIKLTKNPDPLLKKKYLELFQGKFVFFNSIQFDLGKQYDWITNPDSGYQYDITKHWSKIEDFSKQAGDIKYVWEKSRFSFLYAIIRYDYHFSKDCSEIVFKEILSWIDHNPINCGPNYRCSQEISLRILNWIFALYYYKNSNALTDAVFEKIIYNIYWQIKHVYSNINFSRIAVRNNHAITETMGLYLSGMLFPFFPEAAKWKLEGKKWFEQEVAYQVYPDGTFLQFSMNYHRVVIQLLTWGIRLSELNDESLDKVVKDRADASLRFLYNCMNLQDGHLPNYGANDGALFFPLNDRDFRDYRPQLHALSAVLDKGKIDENNEDQFWYGIPEKEKEMLPIQHGMLSYPDGGFYWLRDEDTLSFIRCGNHKDRPSQADNLHLDLWADGRNILGDSGSYKYNADGNDLRYFFGTLSHNSVMLGDFDQMKKGGRFIWYYWTQAIKAGWKEYEDYYEFNGSIRAYQQVDTNIVHSRTVRKYKGKWKWEVTDEVDHDTNLAIHQLWHPIPFANLQITFIAYDKAGKLLPPKKRKGWHSAKYGVKKETEMLFFSSATKQIRTIIEINKIR
jgi:hypothetical protein